MLLSACNRGGERVLETAYVSGVQAILRDRVAAVYEKTGVVKNGERVEVLDHDRRFVKVRTATGVTGWVEQRYLVSQQVYDQIQKLTADNQKDPGAGAGHDAQRHQSARRAGTRHRTSLSDFGRRKAIAAEAGHGRKGGNGSAAVASAASSGAAGNELRRITTRTRRRRIGLLRRGRFWPGRFRSITPAPVIEDWWLVRDSHNRVGWVLGRMIDLDVPLDVAQYAEGQRIVAFFVLEPGCRMETRKSRSI